MLIEIDDYIDASCVVSILRLSRNAVSKLFKRGQFTTQHRIGHFWIVNRKEVEAFAKYREGFKFEPEKDSNELEEALFNNTDLSDDKFYKEALSPDFMKQMKRDEESLTAEKRAQVASFGRKLGGRK